MDNLSFKTDVNNFPKQLKIVIGLKLFGSSTSPLFLYIGFIFPRSQLSGIIPVLKIILNNFTYIFIILLAVDFMYSLIIRSSPLALLFLSFFIHFNISSAVITSLIISFDSFCTLVSSCSFCCVFPFSSLLVVSFNSLKK